MRYQKNRKRPINLKSLSLKKREQMRLAAFQAYEQKRTAYAVAKELNLNESCVGAWFRKFANVGVSAVSEKKRGPAVSPHATLNTKERAILVKAMGRRAARRCLQRMGFTYQCPIRRARSRTRRRCRSGWTWNIRNYCKL